MAQAIVSDVASKWLLAGHSENNTWPEAVVLEYSVYVLPMATSVICFRPALIRNVYITHKKKEGDESVS